MSEAATDGLAGCKRSPGHLVRVLVLAGVALCLLWGWFEFYFLTDDAFITFRYIANHREGIGYTWNPPPFLRVEGYSNFLWMILLEAVWVLAGVEPPRAANLLSLALSCASLAIAFALVWRAPLPPSWQPFRFWFATAVLAAAVTNTTFLAWTSSGLETALFSSCTMTWIFGMLEFGRRGRWPWLTVAMLGASLGALTRPDGIAMVGATGAVIALQVIRTRSWRSSGGMLWPAILVVGHLLWRRSYYGEWVPNTYFAKYVSPWPEAGLRYAGSFVLEYALWAWLVIGAWVLWRQRARFRASLSSAAGLWRSLPVAVVTATLAFQAGYYVLAVGGDHFEYRIFAPLILPLFIALVSMLAALDLRPTSALAVFGVAVAMSLPISWVHHARARQIETRDETFKMFVAVADAFPPGPPRWYAQAFDDLQRWTMPRHVGSRHQEHKVFHEYQVARYPSRAVGREISWEERPIIAEKSVGVIGWVLPHVAILDRHGLNDQVVAMSPPRKRDRRLMAHERQAPGPYIRCFRPNVSIRRGEARVARRMPPLTDAKIRDCQQRHLENAMRKRRSARLPDAAAPKAFSGSRAASASAPTREAAAGGRARDIAVRNAGNPPPGVRRSSAGVVIGLRT